MIKKCEFCGHFFLQINGSMVCSANCERSLKEYDEKLAKKNHTLERLYQEHSQEQGELHESLMSIYHEIWKQEAAWK